MGLIDQIVGAESGGDPAARNSRSSATGAAQFISGTWLDMLSKYRPDLTGSKDELLALRNDPALSREMAAKYAEENGATLTNAGLPVNPGTTYLAHFAGPQGAVKLLQADPGAPAESILGASAVAANPFLRGMTAGDVRAWAERKMGGAPQQQAQQNAPMSPASTARPPLSLAAPSAPIFAPAPQQQAPTAQPQAMAQASPPPSLLDLMPAQMQAPPPIFAPQRKPIDLSRLRAALQASGNRGFTARG